MNEKNKEMKTAEPKSTYFIRELITEDLAKGRFNRIYTRFPPEPNADLHIGHAKAIGPATSLTYNSNNGKMKIIEILYH